MGSALLPYFSQVVKLLGSTYIYDATCPRPRCCLLGPSYDWEFLLEVCGIAQQVAMTLYTLN